MFRAKKSEVPPIEKLQHSVDAVGTIVHQDLPKLMEAISDLKQELGEFKEYIHRHEHISREIRAGLEDVDAKVEGLSGRVDDIQRRLTDQHDASNHSTPGSA
jgi:chromosome segregation ATPase